MVNQDKESHHRFCFVSLQLLLHCTVIRRILIVTLPELQNVDSLLSRDGNVLGLDSFLDSSCQNSELPTGLVTQLSTVTQ